MNENQDEHILADGSIISSPRPTASSTVEKKNIPPSISRNYIPSTMNYSSLSIDGEPSNKSLGILSLDDFDIEKTGRENAYQGDTYARLRLQRQLAESTLNKVKYGLPARFLVPSDSCSKSALDNHAKRESTICETDLLKSAKKISEVKDSSYFNPNNMSTPRNSSNIEVNEKQKSSFYDDITHISEKIRNSDISLKDLLGKFSVGSQYKPEDMSELDSQMFQPAELAGQKLLDDELSWRKARDIPVSTDNFTVDSILSSACSNSIAYDEKVSVGDFFKKKSEDVSDTNFFKTSPERNAPVPLIDLTNTALETHNQINRSNISVVVAADLPNESVLSVSQIAKILSHADPLATPTKVVNYLLKNDFDNGKKSNNVQDGKNDNSNRHKNYEVSSNINEEIEETEIYRELLNSKSSDEYGSDFSNEKQRLKTSSKRASDENKENISRTADRSITSTRSASSLNSLPDGKFPIKSTRVELAWGCLKVGRSNIQEFFIRNQLNQRIRMQASVTGSCFRILKDRADSDMATGLTFLLHPMETKSFYIAFSPTIMGAVSEKLQFYPITNGEILQNKRQTLVLYGYGGYAAVDVVNIAKDSNGKLWLSLGKLDHKTIVTQKLIVKNNGNLNAFACLDASSKGLYAFSVLYVQPKEFVLKPQEEVAVTITYTPAKQDFRNSTASEVVDIGCLKIISGAEPLRGRLRRLCQKLKQKGEVPDPLLERLSNYFIGEAMPADLRLIKETVGVTKELLQQLMVKEITVTLEQDLERTLIGHIDIDETSMYQTLGPDVPNFSAIGDETMVKANVCQFTVEPCSILLTPPLKVADTILIHSENTKPMHFEATVEPESLFQIYPSAGTIPPGETVFLKISCIPMKLTSKDVGRVSIFVENEVMNVPVKCLFIRHVQ